MRLLTLLSCATVVMLCLFEDRVFPVVYAKNSIFVNSVSIQLVPGTVTRLIESPIQVNSSLYLLFIYYIVITFIKSVSIILGGAEVYAGRPGRKVLPAPVIKDLACNTRTNSGICNNTISFVLVTYLRLFRAHYRLGVLR